MATTLERTAGALRSEDFRRLLAMRVASTLGDGLFQAALITSLVFSPEEQTTTAGFAIATLIVVLPYSILGPFAGVFIDRWPRRRILVAGPLLRAASAALVLVDPGSAAVAFYGGALFVLSVNRFFLSAASAVVPRLVPADDLLIANSLATIGGTTALLVGVFAGGLVADAVGTLPLIVACAAIWVLAAVLASTIRSDLRPHVLPGPPEVLRHAVRRVAVEFAGGIALLARTPRALGPIVSMGVDQFGQGLVLVLSLFVFRERFEEGVGSFSYLIGAGGVGVFAGLATVGLLERRFAKERIVGLAFALGGVTLLAVAPLIGRWTVLAASSFVGLSFAWKKIPSDTLVQESVPDGFRGRIFAVYDVWYQISRLLAAFAAIWIVPALGEAWAVASVGVLFLVWSPVLPRWLAGVPELRIAFSDGASSRPVAVTWGGITEHVEIVARGPLDADGRVASWRLAMDDGTTIDVARDDEGWHLIREAEG